MPDLSFQVEGVEAVALAATPLLAFKLRATNRTEGERIHSAMIQCRVDLVPPQRHHSDVEQERLFDLFDRPERWGRTLRRLPWAQTSVVIPAFNGSVVVDVIVPCSGDLDIAASRYLFALEGGEIAVGLAFSGTVFYDAGERGLQVALIAADRFADFRLSLTTWKEMMERHYPDSGWLRLRRDLFDRLSRHKARHGYPTWERALDSLLPTLQGGS